MTGKLEGADHDQYVEIVLIGNDGWRRKLI